jgi:hypothetical protein
MPHGHPPGWTPVEIGLFADSVLKGGKPLPRIDALKIDAGHPAATYSSETGITQAELHYTTDVGRWQDRNWQSITVERGGTRTGDTESGFASASRLPESRPLVLYMTVTDDRGALVSTPHVEIK